MKSDVLDQLRGHFVYVAAELRNQAKQAGLLVNPTGVGTQREEFYQSFLDRHLPKTCGVFLGGYLFDRNGNSSAQIDVIVTTGNTPRFQMPEGNRQIAPLEGSIAVAEIKSRLDRNSLQDALEKCASIPPMPDSKGIVPPYLRLREDKWQDAPYKIVFAYDGINASTVYDHITDFYERNSEIPPFRKPNLVHVLGKYLVMRITPDVQVVNPDGLPDANQPRVGEYKTFITSPDTSAMVWLLNELQHRVFLGNHLLFKYDDLQNKVMERIQRDLTG